ncbi:MAG: glucokinase, partial [Bryobacteraceae bacterium]
MIILAGDVGATNSRLALFETPERAQPVAPLQPASGINLKLLTEQIYPSHGYPGLDTIVTEFLKSKSAKPGIAGIGLAGPVRDGRCVATNLPWIVDSAKLAAAAGM